MILGGKIAGAFMFGIKLHIIPFFILYAKNAECDLLFGVKHIILDG